MKKNDIIEGIITELKFPNKGILKIEDKEIIIKNTLVGQKVRAIIIKKRQNKIEGRLIEVLEPSKIEIKPLCKHAKLCGGCSYQTLPYKEQLNLKQNQVKKLLDSLGNIKYDFLDIVPSPRQQAYRNKMEYSFGDESKGGELSLGMHKRGAFYDIVTVNECKIVDDDFNTIVTAVLEYFKKTGVPFYRKQLHEGILRHLVIRKAVKTKEILINLVTSSQQQLDLTQLADIIKNLKLDGKVIGFLHTINDSLADVVKSDQTKVVFGQDYFTEELLGLKFKISAFSFFQTNSLGAEKLYSKVREFAGEGKGKIIFDLYCGTGTIAQIISPIAKKVIGIEIVEEAVKAAKENAKLNNLDNCDFIAGDVLKQIDNINEKPDLIILDPPREGIHPKALKKIIKFDAKELIYISCKPTSLVRDLEVLLENGYKIDKVQCVDMFPFTTHVECCCCLTRVK